MEHRFNSILVESIDEVLASLVEPVKNQLYIKLEEIFFIQKNQIPDELKDFSEFLFRTLGPAACLIQIKIIKSFNTKLAKEIAGNFQPITLFDDFSLVSYFNEMRLSKNYQTILT